MAQFIAPGGGISDSGDKRVERKVVVSTDGNPSAPGGNGILTNVSITEEPGGVRRGVFEYTRGGAGDASYNAYGKKYELIGGTREVPIYMNPAFASLNPQQIIDVKNAVAEGTTGPFPDATQDKLFGFLVRGEEYALAPSITARVSEIESNLPSLLRIAKAENPTGLSAPANTFWICTGISASSIGDKYEVTREYTLSWDGWDDVKTLYGG